MLDRRHRESPCGPGQNSHRTKELRKPHTRTHRHPHGHVQHWLHHCTKFISVNHSSGPPLGYCCTCRLLITCWKTSGAAATSTAERRTKKHEAERQRTEKMPRSSQIISGNYRDRPRSRTTVRPRDCTATGASQSHAPRMTVRKSP